MTRVHDRRFPLRLDVVGDDETALARLEEGERVLLDERRLDEPSAQLGEVGELGGAVEQERVGVGGRQRGGSSRSVGGSGSGEQPPPAGEGRRRLGAEAP